ncbi:N-acetylmuramoyl-L-alanine amidase [Oscillospiraceae bacterium PP1C4]
MAKKIWIDPGHGGTDSGAIHPSGRTEKEDNLKYALELEKQFRARGLETVLTRSTDVTMSLAARTALENSEGCALALSCHRNGGVASANGFEVWLHSNAPDSFVAWGNAICGRMKELGFKDRGTHKGYVTDPTLNYAVNRDTKSPSMLIEMGFVSSDVDNALFDTKLTGLCAAIADECCTFLGSSVVIITPPAEDVVKPAEPTVETVPKAEYDKLQAKHDALIADLNTLTEKYK